MKQIFRILGVFCFLLLFITEVKAQDPAFSQFYANPLYLNPAFAGASSGGLPPLGKLSYASRKYRL